ncbi:MAG: bifunctional oligoribonuclease/PAP phosphatase NrnA [Candidatus Gastranaerophilales bacterium]|nr:bifunctional oligoribonuclease/PAP phosphatase NrnA [Candidatus Gastranaerophilales bacterium]
MEKEILNVIENSSKILIITHVNPDGDTLGSASALKSFIGDKCDILIQIEDNFQFPSTYHFLPHLNNALNFSTLKNRYDLVIALDCASIDRIIAPAREIFDNCENTIAIDHHKTNKGYAKYNHVRGGISSTGEVLYDLFKIWNKEITKEMAIGLYSAILTDTGCFKYESTTSHTFEIASNLSKIGINTSEIADLCYTNKPKNLVLFQNYLITNAVFCLNDKIAYTLITKEIQEKFQAKDEYTEGICETLRSIRNVEAAFVLKETQIGTKVSIRTKDLDATKIAGHFQGGGHKRAAGCTIKEKLNKASEMLLGVTKELL